MSYKETIFMGAVPMVTDAGDAYASPAFQTTPPAAPQPRTTSPTAAAAAASASTTTTATTASPKAEVSTPNISDEPVKAETEGGGNDNGGDSDGYTKYIPYAIGAALLYFFFIRKK